MLSGSQLQCFCCCFLPSWGLHQAERVNVSHTRFGFSSACPLCRCSTHEAAPRRGICLPASYLSRSVFLPLFFCPKLDNGGHWENSPERSGRGRAEQSSPEQDGVGMRRWRKKDGDWEYWHIYTMINLLLVTYILWFNLYQTPWGRWSEPSLTKEEVRCREVN